MLFTKPSGDVKYNKIKEIEQLLSLPTIIIRGEPTMTRKQVSALRWVLANKVYDLSVAGLDVEEELDWSCKPEHWSDLINRLNNRSWKHTYPYHYSYLEGSWLIYNYTNS